jgi:hypothetical protein
MDRIASPTDYPRIVRKIITEYAAFLPAYSDVQAETILDDEHAHYMLFYTGWDGKHRVHGSAIHITLRGDKVWVQHDGTKDGIVDELIAAGIPIEKIVLGFHHPDERKYTEFAVA